MMTGRLLTAKVPSGVTDRRGVNVPAASDKSMVIEVGMAVVVTVPLVENTRADVTSQFAPLHPKELICPVASALATATFDANVPRARKKFIFGGWLFVDDARASDRPLSSDPSCWTSRPG